MKSSDWVQDRSREIAKATVRQWDKHDKFRVVEGEDNGEPDEVIVARALLRVDREYGCEIMDPSGTIWDHATNVEKERDRLKEEVERLRKAMILAECPAGDIGWGYVMPDDWEPGDPVPPQQMAQAFREMVDTARGAMEDAEPVTPEFCESLGMVNSSGFRLHRKYDIIAGLWLLFDPAYGDQGCWGHPMLVSSEAGLVRDDLTRSMVLELLRLLPAKSA